MSAILDACEEKTNGTRLGRLVVDGGTHVLRDYFNSVHTPAQLKTVLGNHFHRLHDLWKKKKIYQEQWEKLFPPSGDPPDSKTFDITLLHLLIREICFPLVPNTYWSSLPAATDTSLQANIARIRFFRNDLQHSVSTGIPTDEFKDKWRQVSLTLAALGFDQTEIDRLETEPIDHDTDRRIEEEVKKWKRELEPRVGKLEQEVQQMKSKMSTTETTSCLPDKPLNVLGRSLEIQKVVEAIEHSAVVITGGPGFGKTTVAKEVAHKLAANPSSTVLFCILGSKAAAIDVANSMILGCCNYFSQPPENPEHWLKNWSRQQKQIVTFVLDNADDVLDSNDRGKFISILRDMRMLSQKNVNFVVTSRRAFTDDSLNVREVRLKEMASEDAVNVLVSEISCRSIQPKPTKIEKLADLCGRVPLALHIVGSLLSDYPEEKLIEDLEKKPLEVLREDQSDHNSVEKAIETSFNYLSDTERKALSILSAIPGSFNSDAATAFIESCKDLCGEPISILRTLKNRSLVEQLSTCRYQIHQFIQAFVKKNEVSQEFLDQGEEMAYAHFITRLADNALKYWSKDNCKESITSFNDDRHNFEFVLHLLIRKLNNQDRLMTTTSRFLTQKLSQKCLYLEMCLHPKTYMHLLKKLLCFLKSRQQLVPARVELLCLLGHESRKVGNQEEYKEYLEQAREVYSQNPSEFGGENWVSKAFFLNNYARFLADERRPNDANKYFTHALNKCEEQHDLDDVQNAVTLLYAGREDKRHNKRDLAEKKFIKSLQLYQKSLGKHVMTALLLKELGDFHLFHGEKELRTEEGVCKSIEQYKEALEMMEELGMKDCKECILTLTNLGICYESQNNFKEAMELYQESWNIAERELVDAHRWKIYVMTQMAHWNMKTANVEEAKVLKEQAMQMSRQLNLSDNQPPNKFLLKKI
ncbi:nephrocystin-3-like [Montipora capricornis]|uniref:nephrocystin-3-like n=1 Tax=Montipora foliosa TaxID=591990 RepID=UPI0035F1E16F